MAGRPQQRPEVREHHARRADGGEPLYSDPRSITQNGNSLVIGLTDYAVKTHSIECGQTPTVEVYPDGIWIDVGGGSDE